MRQRSQVALSQLFFKYPFPQSSKPISSFLPKFSASILNRYVSVQHLSPIPEIFCLPISKYHCFLHPISSNHLTRFRNHEELRNFSGKYVPSFDQNKEIDDINLKFAEAREEIEMALESKETVYFDEEAESARVAVKIVLDTFEGPMAKLPESERAALQRSMGLKIEQLNAELEQLKY